MGRQEGIPVLADDDEVVIEGTPAELKALVERMTLLLRD